MTIFSDVQMVILIENFTDMCFVKVETIGDAYMVVAGVPEVISDHAQRVCNFGLDMIGAASSVPSPATGKPLQVHQPQLPNFSLILMKTHQKKRGCISASLMIVFCLSRAIVRVTDNIASLNPCLICIPWPWND